MFEFRQFGQGSFTAGIEGCYHCGPDHTSPKKFDYKVEIVYDGEPLDARGFLMDNLSFKEYFDGIGVITESCELLARRAAIALWRKGGGKCKVLKVSIWGIPDVAMVEFVLDCDPDELPARKGLLRFLPKRRKASA